MKKIIQAGLLAYLSTTSLSGLLIDRQAPSFSAPAVSKNGHEYTVSLNDLGAVVLVFYPKDFTFVCPTELRAFQMRMKDFTARNMSVIGISTDTLATHKKWLATPIKKGGIADVTFPLIADTDGAISRAYGVLNEAEHIAYRGIFILDKNHRIQSIIVNNNALGRNIDEVLRIIDAMQEAERCGMVCPANWHKGERVMAPTKAGLKQYLAETAN